MSLDYFNDGNFIPVELPERAVHDERAPDRPKFLSSTSVVQGNFEGDIIQSPHLSHHGSPPYQWSADAVNSTRSPGSEISFTSDESINIIGDVFSAPTRLKDIMNKLTHVKHAGDQYYWSYLFPTASLCSSSSDRSESKETINSLLVSPSARPPPTPPCLRQNASSLPLDEILTPKKNPSLSPLSLGNRPKLSPKGPRNSSRQAEGSPNMSRNQRRNRYRNREDRTPLTALNSVPSPQMTKISGTGASQLTVPEMTSMRRQSSPQITISTLNPFAPSFDPGHLPRPRALSLPEDPISCLNETFSPSTQPLQEQSTYPQCSIHRQLFQSLPPVAPQKLQTIQQDLPHLREWSNQFGMAPHYVVGNAATWPHVEQHYPSLQNYPFPPVNRMAQGQLPFVYDAPPVWVPLNHCGPQYHVPPYGPIQAQATRPLDVYPSGNHYLSHHDDIAAYNHRPGHVDGLRRPPPRFVPAPLLTPVELPETRTLSGTSPSNEPGRKTMMDSEHSNPRLLISDISRAEIDKFPSSNPPQIGTNGLRFKPVFLGLTERGVPALTPVTERSEVSSSDISLTTDVDLAHDDGSPRDPGKRKRSNRRSKKPSGMTYTQDQNSRTGEKKSKLI